MSGGGEAGNAPSPAWRPLELAVKAMGGKVLQAGARGGTFAGAATDSREVGRGQLFFALPGERVDGFQFAAQAASAGAVAVVVAPGRGIPEGCAELAVIAVDDPRRALGELARHVRNEFTGRVVGVTGSNGKTTTKELIAAALRPLGPTLRTPGNRNTDVGLPLTILSASGREATWVLEMAMRARGEIAELARIGRPDIGVVTNVAAAHLETLGSIEEVARAKGEIFGGLGPNGIAILPADDPLIFAEAQVVPPERRLTFGSTESTERGGAPQATSRSVDVRVLDFVPAGAAGSVVRYAVGDVPVVVRLPLGGAHNARNGAAALAVARAAGVPAVAAAAELERVELPPHRSAAIAVGGRTILDDAYNANPGSMRAAIAAVVAAAGGDDGAGRVASDAAPCALAILGDMLELGPDAAAYHEAIGREAGARLGGVVAVGVHAAAVVAGARAAGLTAGRAVTASSPEEAARIVAAWTGRGDWILVKASRGLRLERAVETLRSLLDPRPAPPLQPNR